MTDAGVSAEWAEFFDALAPYPTLAGLLIGLPGNHDLNVVDRANPARFDLPTSPAKRLRQMRTLSALAMIQGFEPGDRQRLGASRKDTGQAIEPHRAGMAAFADQGSIRLSWRLADLWTEVFPMVFPPDAEDGLGVIVLNSNASTHFSFTNALGMISLAQARGIDIAVAEFPRAILDRGAPSPRCRVSESGETLSSGSVLR